MLMEGEELLRKLDGIIHEETQVGNRGVDLTANKIFRPKSRGELDFGGSERKDTDLEKIDPEKRSKEDDYGWWELDEGLYQVELNEKVRANEENGGLIVPLKRTCRNGAFHPALPAAEPLEGMLPLFIGPKGLSVKENARISKIIAWR